MTEEEKIICKQFLNDADKTHSCNEYKLLMALLNQEPRKGHWIEHDWKEMRERGYYRCSVCNCGYQRYTKGIRKSDVPYIDGKEYTLRSIDNYCPNCGADMREVEE